MSTRVRRFAATCAAVMVVAGVTACSGDEEDSSDQPGTGSSAEERPDEPIHTTVERVSGHLDKQRRDTVKDGVNKAVDGWFEGAFLGSFPRDNYDQAFAAFTSGARKDALRDLDVLSNSKISDRIDSASAGNRRVRLDVLAPRGDAQGVTARFVLDYFTYGELEQHRRVKGSLYLVQQQGHWRIFGYDVQGAHKR